jgi:hypothetical protein
LALFSHRETRITTLVRVFPFDYSNASRARLRGFLRSHRLSVGQHPRDPFGDRALVHRSTP